MNRIITLIIAFAACLAGECQVTVGIENLVEMGFAPLKGKRVGLITNATGVDRNLRSTIDIINEAPGVKLVALFSPEHGIRGNHSAGVAVKDDVDAVTGVKIHSLHGRNLSPTAEMLKGIDVMVYDIQDVGARSYTYISTMGRSMEACAAAGVEFMVLDRPNPLGGYKVEGPTVVPGNESFVAQYAIPYIYGLTPGELARLLCGVKLLRGGVAPKLTVIEMKGWNRSMHFSDTRQPWVLPSPNIPQPVTPFYYPATGIAGELDGISIGVGYTLPFQLFAMPGVDGLKLSQSLNALKLDGVKFRPISFTPRYSKLANQSLSGVEIYVTEPEKATLTLIQFYILQEVHRLWPDLKIFEAEKPGRLEMMDKVTGNPQVRRKFARRYEVSDILDIWNADVEKFKATKQKYHLY